MTVSLHAVAVETYLQILPSIAGLVQKAEEHCTANGQPASALTEASISEDMWPFAKQVFECGHHSARAIEGVRAGVFSPEVDPVPSDFATLHKQVADSIATLQAVDPGELDAIAQRDMTFKFGEREMPFTVEGFLLTFSLPNFYFHAATAYNILRGKGLQIGKMDYLGKIRLKQ